MLPLKWKVSSCFLVASFILLFQNLYAAQYPLPATDNSVIGDLTYIPGAGESIDSVGRNYDIGVNAFVNANRRSINDVLIPGDILVPTQHVLPPSPRRGIVINLAEMRMYYYSRDAVITFPIGIGRVGKTVPTGKTSIARKAVNPSWMPPEDIREYDRIFQDIELPRVMGPGPDNPLGHYALYLRVPTFLIHSTIYPDSIGRRASFGCIRMNEKDIKELFALVQAGTPVAIIDVHNKLGWQDNTLFLEAHPPLEESFGKKIDTIATAIQKFIARDGGVTLVDWQMVAYISKKRDGVPHEIGVRID